MKLPTNIKALGKCNVMFDVKVIKKKSQTEKLNTASQKF